MRKVLSSRFDFLSVLGVGVGKETYFLIADIKKYTLENYDEHYNKLYRYRELL